MERMSSANTFVEVKPSPVSLVPPSWEREIREIALNECDAAGLSLAHCFATDPLSQYLVDGEDMAGYSAEDRWKLHVAIMTTVVASHHHRGIVTTIGPDFDALAIWAPPQSNTDDWWTMIRSGMLKLYFQLGAEGRKRYYKEMLPLLHDTKHEVLGDRDDDSYYLVYIGTKPAARGKGYASKLIRDMIAKADAEDRAMYLESSSAANNRFYERFGFEFRKTITVNRGLEPITLDIMVREPHSRKLANSSPVLPEAVCDGAA